MDIDIGLAIKRLRGRCGHTQESLALLIGSDASNLSRIERNKQWPSKSVLLRLSEALGTTPSGLFREAEVVCAPFLEDAKAQYRPRGDRLQQFIDYLSPEQRDYLNQLIDSLQNDSGAPRKPA